MKKNPQVWQIDPGKWKDRDSDWATDEEHFRIIHEMNTLSQLMRRIARVGELISYEAESEQEIREFVARLGLDLTEPYSNLPFSLCWRKGELVGYIGWSNEKSSYLHLIRGIAEAQ